MEPAKSSPVVLAPVLRVREGSRCELVQSRRGYHLAGLPCSSHGVVSPGQASTGMVCRWVMVRAQVRMAGDVVVAMWARGRAFGCMHDRVATSVNLGFGEVRDTDERTTVGWREPAC
jgi:hypothetical protein